MIIWGILIHVRISTSMSGLGRGFSIKGQNYCVSQDVCFKYRVVMLCLSKLSGGKKVNANTHTVVPIVLRFAWKPTTHCISQQLSVPSLDLQALHRKCSLTAMCIFILVTWGKSPDKYHDISNISPYAFFVVVCRMKHVVSVNLMPWIHYVRKSNEKYWSDIINCPNIQWGFINLLSLINSFIFIYTNLHIYISYDANQKNNKAKLQAFAMRITGIGNFAVFIFF